MSKQLHHLPARSQFLALLPESLSFYPTVASTPGRATACVDQENRKGPGAAEGALTGSRLANANERTLLLRITIGSLDLNGQYRRPAIGDCLAHRLHTAQSASFGRVHGEHAHLV
jgi:hypothetical protein